MSNTQGLLSHVHKRSDVLARQEQLPSWSRPSSAHSSEEFSAYEKSRASSPLPALTMRTRKMLLGLGFLAVVYLIAAAFTPAQNRPVPRFYDKYAQYPTSLDGHRSFSIDDSNVPLCEFLEWHWPADDPNPVRVWLTLSDSWWINRGTANLQYFINEMNLVNEQETVLVVLCLDKACHRDARKNKMFTYSGYPKTRPEQILTATWPKLASLIDVLKHRDVFFVDSDVSFRASPYPFMDPLMATNDLIIQENMAFNHANTGWFWMRKGRASSDAWKAVLDMDMEKESRDQFNFNTVLDTDKMRVSGGVLKSDFVAKNGLRVHILDKNTFRSHHFELDDPRTQRSQSVYLHMTCGDDFLTKEIISMTQGFWSDVERHYVNDKKILSIGAMSGTQGEVNKMLSILLAVAHFTHRSFEPPEYISFSDINTQKRAYSAYPLAHIGRDYSIDVLEPGFTRFAINTLAHKTSLDFNSTPADTNTTFYNKNMWPVVLGSERERLDRIVELTDIVEVDVRAFKSLKALVDYVLSLRRVKHIKLIHFDWLTGTSWRQWTDIPSRLTKFVLPCTHINTSPTCDNMCMFRNYNHEVYVDKGVGKNDWW